MWEQSGSMNQLQVNQQQNIVQLHQRGWSRRRIARELGLDRGTVRKYVDRAKPATHPQTGSASKPATQARTGSTDPEDPKPAIVQTGSAAVEDPKPAIAQTGSGGAISKCQPFAERIVRDWGAGLSIQRIAQDLRAETEFCGSYHSVRRFVLGLGEGQPPFRRMECAPGEELQVDFGQGAWVIDEQGKRRRPHLFRAILSHSRKGYSEVVWKQDTETFIRCLENCFRALGGVTLKVVIDNLKAGVLKPDWYEPDLNPKLAEFAAHYGTLILPAKPRMPRHKGKVEAGVKYGQNNALKGRRFSSLAEQNRFLQQWEKHTADTRIHGTTRRQVGEHFRNVEAPALKALPAELFPHFVEAPRKVHRDGHVEYRRAYYSVPPEYLGHQVWLREETRLIRIFNQRRQPIAVHTKAEAGTFTTDPAHLHSRKRCIIERGADYLLDQCRVIGPHTGAWAEGMHRHKGEAGLRVMQGLLELARRHPVDQLEKAAAIATHHAVWRLKDLKRLLQQPSNVIQMDFLQSHPLIRPLDHYQLNDNEQQEQA